MSLLFRFHWARQDHMARSAARGAGKWTPSPGRAVHHGVTTVHARPKVKSANLNEGGGGVGGWNRGGRGVEKGEG